jgi:hypothetical protein
MALDQHSRGCETRLASLLGKRTVTAFDIIARPGLLSVTESVCAPASTRTAVNMPGNHGFDIRDWLVPPVLVPLFFALLIAAMVLVR